ncbi:transporter [Halalkalicoccus subterraneus]|uniref:transporter n=1 Tax=Halalkalicoccus subterraneus TaxID=2675002 RepID=UPI000EFA9867|nr:transporter [Halalkalicoccus subterraneus]
MSLLDAAMNGAHLGFAGLWVGSVIFLTVAVLPLAREGAFDAAPLETVTSRLQWISRISALALFASGGHLAGTRYTVDSLFGSAQGHLVLVMLTLWFLLALLVELGSKKLATGFAQRKVRQPAHEARPYFLVASLVGVLLFVDAGFLSVPTAIPV